MSADNKKFISTKEASSIVGRSSDYIGRLAREGKIPASRIGKAWVVDRGALLTFFDLREATKEIKNQKLSEVRKEEYVKVFEPKIKKNNLLQKFENIPFESAATFAVAVLVVFGGYSLASASGITSLPFTVANIIHEQAFNAHRAFARADRDPQRARANYVVVSNAAQDEKREIRVENVFAKTFSNINAFGEKFEYGGVQNNFASTYIPSRNLSLLTVGDIWSAYKQIGERIEDMAHASFGGYENFTKFLGKASLANALAARDISYAATESVFVSYESGVEKFVNVSQKLPELQKEITYAFVDKSFAVADAFALVPYKAGGLILESAQSIPEANIKIGKGIRSNSPKVGQAIIGGYVALVYNFVDSTYVLTDTYKEAIEFTGDQIGTGYAYARFDLPNDTLAVADHALDISTEAITSRIERAGEQLASQVFIPVTKVAIAVPQNTGSAVAQKSSRVAVLASGAKGVVEARIQASVFGGVRDVFNRIFGRQQDPVLLVNPGPAQTNVVIKNDEPTYIAPRSITQNFFASTDVNKSYVDTSITALHAALAAELQKLTSLNRNQIVQNIQTIQWVNKIEDISDTIIRRPEVIGGILRGVQINEGSTFSGASVTAGTGTFGTLNAATTTITGPLTVPVVIATGTSTFATTTLTGSLTGTTGTFTSATTTNFFATNASTTNATSTNIFSNNATLTNATSTNFYTSVLEAVTATLTNLTATNATTTNATTTNLAISGLTAGSIPFIGTGGLVVEDNSNFFFDNANNRLGVGTATPATTFDINATDAIRIPVGTSGERPSTSLTGQIRYNSTTAQYEGYNGSAWVGLGGVIDIDQDTYVTAEESSDEDFLRFYTGGTERAVISSTGNFGIGTTSPYAKLSVVGQTVAEYFTATSTTLASTFPLLSSTNATSTQFAIGSLTSGRIPYATTGGRLIDDADLTFDGTTLSATRGVFTNATTTNATSTNLAISGELKTSYNTPSRLLTTNASGIATSTDIASWIAGTSNQITVTDDSDGSVTLSLPSSLSFTDFTATNGTTTNATSTNLSVSGTLNLSGLTASRALFLDANNNAVTSAASSVLASSLTDETGTGALVFANSPTLVTPALGTPSAAVLTNATGLPVSTGISGLGSGIATWLATPSSANLISAVTDETGTGNLVFSASPTFTGTANFANYDATNGTTTNATSTNLSVSGTLNLSGLTASRALFLDANNNAVTSAASSVLASSLTDETGTGALVFANSPTLVTPALGTPSAAVLTNATGLPLSTGVTGTLPVANGGTGATTFTNNRLLTGNGTSAIVDEANLTFDGSTLGVTGNLQLSSASNSYFIGGGNVGIGTTSPDSLLHVAVGDSGAVASSPTGVVIENNGDTQLHFLNPNVNAGNIFFGDVADADRAIFGYTHAGDRFRFMSAGGASELLVIEQGGNVGIGTSSPETKLEVAGGNILLGNTYGLQIEDSTGSNRTLVSFNGSDMQTFGTTNNNATFQGFDVGFNAARSAGGGADEAFLFTATNDLGSSDEVFQIADGGGNLVTVMGGGNVGIGTSSPYAKLSVVGQTVAEYFTATSTSLASTFPLANFTSATSTNFYASTFGINSEYISDLTGNGLSISGGQLSIATSSLSATSGFFLQNGNSFGETAILGTNDSNNLAFETGGSTRVTIDTSGNVGIGDASPDAQLDIVDTSTTGTGLIVQKDLAASRFITNVESQLSIRGNTDDTERLLIGYATDENYGYIEAVDFGSTFNRDLVLNSQGGNVGISTTTPQAKLDVSRGGATYPSISAGTAAIFSGTSNQSGVNGISILAGDTTEAYINFGDRGSENQGRIIYNNGNDDLSFRTNGSSKNALTIDSSGNVGIGTTTPASKLDIYSATTPGARINWDTTSSYGTFQFYEAATLKATIQALGSGFATADRQNALELVTGSGGPIAFRPNGNEAVRVTSSGNVGIGTTSPDTLLHLSATANSSGGLLIEDASDSAGNIATAEIRGRRSDTNSSLTFGGALYLSRLYSGGATTPGVNDSFSQLGNIAFGGNHTDGTAGNIEYAASIGGLIEGTFNSDTDMPTALVFRTGVAGTAKGTTNGLIGTERLRITSGGKVGIGNTSPDQTLHVSSSGTREGLSTAAVFTDNTDDRKGVFIGFNSTADYGLIAASDLGAAWKNLVLQPTSGNVGIGTTSPGNKLSIYTGNAANANEGITLTRGSVGAPQDTQLGFRLKSDASGVYRGAITVTNGAGASETEALTILSSGNVGIGTTTPAYLLDVDGDFNVGEAGNAQAFYVDATGNYAAIGTNADSGEELHIYDAEPLITFNRSGAYTWSIGEGGGTKLPQSYYGIYDDSVNAARLVIAHTTGNVGIGTTTPYAKLSVSDNLTNGTFNILQSFSGETIYLPTAGGAMVTRYGNNSTDYAGFGAYGNGTEAGAAIWSGSSVSGEPAFFIDATGNVGIGTSTPEGIAFPSTYAYSDADTNSLVIQGNNDSSGDTGIFLRRNDGATGLDLWQNSGNGDVYIDSRWAGGDINFRTQTGSTAVDAVTISASGYLGVGTTSPVAVLDIQQSANDALGGIALRRDGAPGTAWTITNGNGVSGELNNFFIGTVTATNNGGDEASDFAEHISIRGIGAAGNTGNVGISTSTPWAQLSVEGQGGKPGFVVGDSSNNVDFIVTENGNVGIGDSTPGNPLEINTTNTLGATFTGTTNGEGVRVTQTDYTSGNYVSLIEGAYDDSNASANVRIGAMYDGGGSNLAIGTSNSYGAGITNQALWINSAGWVGIGTTTEKAPFSVGSGSISFGDSYRSTAHIQNDNYESALTLRGGSSGYFHAVLNLVATSGTNARALGTHAYDEVGTRGWFWGRPYTTSDAFAINRRSTTGFSTDIADTNDADVDNLFYINNSGNVGINTNSPTSAKLIVNNDSDGANGFIFSAGGNSRLVIASAASGSHAEVYSANNVDLRLGVGSSPTDLVIKNGGNVGIGTTTPSSPLDVWGTSNRNSPLVTINSNGVGGGGAGYDKGLLIDIGSAAGSSSLFNVKEGGDSKFYIQTVTGNVGIGTTTPALKLSIVNGAFGGTEGTSISDFSVSDGNHVGFELNAPSSKFTSIYFRDESNASSSSEGYIRYQHTDDSLRFMTNSTVEDLVINSSGNVGIGTTTPTVRLAVEGSIDGNIFQLYDTDGNCLYNPEAGSVTVTCSSDERLKTDIVDASSALSYLNDFRIRDYTVIASGEALTGVIAQEVQAVHPELVSEQGGYLSVELPNTWKLLQGIQEVDSKISAIEDVLNIDALGNIGIGTTTPAYKLHVLGDVAATSFVNISTREEKKGITYLDEIRKEDILDTLKAVQIAEYRYSYESDTNPLRLGLIAEEAPSEVLSASLKGVDIYKMATFTLSAVQSLAMKVETLEERIAALEASGVIGAGGGVFSTTTLKSAFLELGVLIEKGFAQFDKLAFKQLIAEKDTAGEAAAGTGTIFSGNKLALVENSQIKVSSKVFITFTSPVVGSWFITDKANGSFRVTLDQAQGTDVTFDYFIVQTERDAIPTSDTGVVDTEAPVVTILGANPYYLATGTVFVDPGVSITDNVDQNLTHTLSVNGYSADTHPLDTSSAGTNILTYKVLDTAGNLTTETRSVIIGSGADLSSTTETATSTPSTATTTPEVVATTTPAVVEEVVVEEAPADTTAPVVTLVGGAAIALTAGDAFTDEGATATDDVDGDITPVVSGEVDTATAGLYTLTYTATDTAGNESSVSRIVTVAVPVAEEVVATTTPAVI